MQIKQEDIRAEIDKVNNEIDDARHNLDILKQNKKRIQSKCKHPNQHQYSAQGEVGWYCPDCEMQT